MSMGDSDVRPFYHLFQATRVGLVLLWCLQTTHLSAAADRTSAIEKQSPCSTKWDRMIA